MDFLRMLLQQMFQGGGGWGSSQFTGGSPTFNEMQPPTGGYQTLPYQIPQQTNQAPVNYLPQPFTPPGGDVQPVGGGRNWSGPVTAQDPSFGGGGLGYGGIGGGAWGGSGVPGQQFGTGRMYAGGNPNFNEMAGPWMTTALGGTGRINPLQPSGDQYVGSAGSYSPMSQAPFELR